MIFEIDEIPEDGLDFEMRAPRDRFEIDQEGCTLNQDVRVSGTLNPVGNEVYFNGRFETGLHLACQLCLEPFDLPVSGKAAAHYVAQDSGAKEPGEVELHAGDIDVEPLSEGRVDLSRCVRDQILLEVPVVPRCRNDCRGLCPQCGANRNRESCACAALSSGDPRMAVLKSLKNRLQ